MKSYKGRIIPAAMALLMAVLLAGCAGNSLTDEGMELVQSLSYSDALAKFDEAENAGEDIRLIMRGRGIAYMGLTEYAQAVECFESALSSGTGFVQDVDYDINYYMAAAYCKNGQYAEAERIYDAILALREKEETAYFLRGTVCLAQSDYEGAKQDFDLVISMDSKNYDRLIDIYQAMEHYGYGSTGQEYLNNALSAGESSMDSFDKGRIYYYLGQYQEAALLLEESREDGGAESTLFLGRAYEAIGEYNYATNVYSSYIAKDAGNAEIYNQLGLCNMSKQDYQAALEAFQAGMQIEDNGMMQTLAFNEIMAYEYLGEYQKAAVLINNYMATYPDDDVAAREQEFLSTR
ncbi:MAG: tetratricopeptide repeat protein [Lachnospiraceae bacterium]|nr:tetratricopeptide repeat protein [Lachnospiraceae bacterium]